MSIKFWEMKFDGTRYKDKTGIVWELDGTKHYFCAYITGDMGYATLAVLTTHYTHKQLVDMEFEEVIDWSKVPIDTKILVWWETPEYKEKRHFAGLQDVTGYVLAWEHGQTSFTTDKTASWMHAELYKEESEK